MLVIRVFIIGTTALRNVFIYTFITSCSMYSCISNYDPWEENRVFYKVIVNKYNVYYYYNCFKQLCKVEQEI